MTRSDAGFFRPSAAELEPERRAGGERAERVEGRPLPHPGACRREEGGEKQSLSGQAFEE